MQRMGSYEEVKDFTQNDRSARKMRMSGWGHNFRNN